MACLKGAAKEGRDGRRLRLERSMNDLVVVIFFHSRYGTLVLVPY